MRRYEERKTGEKGEGKVEEMRQYREVVLIITKRSLTRVHSLFPLVMKSARK